MRCMLLLVAILATSGLRAQESLGADGPMDRLRVHLQEMREARFDADRDTISTRIREALLAALDVEKPMKLSFDEVPMSRVDAPDERFRLFTWNVPYSDGHHGYEGILLVQDRRSVQVFELRDMTSGIGDAESAELEPGRWYGALYYDVVAVQHGGRTYYTLLGWKGHSRTETRKVIEVLSFRGRMPRFGAAIFGGGRPKPQRRVFAYSAAASMSLRWQPGAERIVFDHLSPSRPEMEGQHAFYGPDMRFDAYRWEKGQWQLETDVDARLLERSDKPWNDPRPPGQRRGRQ